MDLSSGYKPIHSPLDTFISVSDSECHSQILHCPNKQCRLDPIPTRFVKSNAELLAPIIGMIVNRSLSSGIFPDELKKALVTPIIKKPSLDKNNLKNYRPVSNLSFTSKFENPIITQCTAAFPFASFVQLNVV